MTQVDRLNEGGFKVMSRCCGECLTTKNRIVSAKRAAEIICDAKKNDGYFQCHKGSILGADIACRGYYDATGGGQMARISKALGCFIEIDADQVEIAVKAKAGRP